jgi:hypothetical protein
MADLIKHPASFWVSTNPILLLNQAGIELDTGLAKFGDGITTWNSLAYFEMIYEFTSVSGTDTYIASLKMPLILGYFIGMRLRVLFTNANTGASTINVNGFGAIAIKKNVSLPLIIGDILAGGIYDLTYDGTNFQIK